jgi:benzoyl-CoA reductase subunit D
MTGTLRVVGIDVGTSAIKAVVLEESEQGAARVLGRVVERMRRRDPQRVAHDAFEQVLRDAGTSRGDLAYVATTGEGEVVPFRTGHFYGMTTHARGALFLDPEARAVLDIGALHTRAVVMDARAKVLGYRMTSQCASGSGQFLENICRYLGITIDEIGPLSLRSEAPEACSSICAVLAETDVINMVSRGISSANIIRGIHQSMAGRYVRLLAAAGASGAVLVSGGLAADVGMLAAIREVPAKVRWEVRSHPDSILAGAYGAALWGAYRTRKLAREGITLSPGAAA